MKIRIKKKDFIAISIISIIIAYFIPFAFKSKDESTLDVLSVSLSAIGTVATVITLFIAINLYQKFGLESRFIGTQTDKILEIVDLFKGKSFMANTNSFTYICGTNKEKIKMLKTGSNYQLDKNRIVLINDKDFTNTWDKLLEIKRSYWLPAKIKKKIEFLDFIMFDNVADAFDEKYIRIYNDSINKTEIKDIEWLITNPTITFEEYNISINALIKSIEKWLRQHSDIKIDLNLIEPEKYNNKNTE